MYTKEDIALPDNKARKPMEHHNIGDFLKGQSSKILTAIADADKTAYVLKNGKPIEMCIRDRCSDCMAQKLLSGRIYGSTHDFCYRQFSQGGAVSLQLS